MTIQMTPEGMKALLPRAPQVYIGGLIADQAALDAAGITHTRERFSVCFANVEHECGGFTIPNLTENINYSAERMAQVWPNRFPRGASDVRSKYGTAPGWQRKAFDDIYGNRMGNRPGTSDGSAYIGRAGPQITGRGGYAEIEKRTGIPLVANPELASKPEHQAAIIAAFWSWKNMNRYADVGDRRGACKAWNGGYNGWADREALYRGNDPVTARMEKVMIAKPVAKTLPGVPPTKEPPKDVVDEATKKERALGTGGVVSGGTGTVGEVTKAGTQQPDTPAPAFLSPFVTYTLIGAGVAMFIVAAILIARKKQIIRDLWN